MTNPSIYVEQTTPPDRPNPQKRNILLQRLKRAPWWLLVTILLLIYIYGEWSGSIVYQTVWESVKIGIETTITVSVRAYALALVLGLVLALMRLADNFVLYQTATFYVEVVRGIPTLILVYYVALALTPKMVDWLNIAGDWMLATPLTIDWPFWEYQRPDLDFWGRGTYLAELRTRDIEQTHRVIAALAVSYSAFLSEVFRAGIQSIGKGQTEAARSLGLSRWQTMRLVVLPQAIRLILPPLGNDFIAMLKESSLVSVVGVEDITRRGQTTATSTFRFFEVYNVVALTYLVLTLSLAIGVKLMESYLEGDDSRGFSLSGLRQSLNRALNRLADGVYDQLRRR